MSPPRKKNREEEAAITNDPNSGFIRFEVDNVSKLTKNGQYSHEIEVCGMPWKLRVYKDKDWMPVFLYTRESGSNIWSIDVSCEFRLMSAAGGKDHSQSMTTTHNHKYPAWGKGSFVSWTGCIDENKGFVKNDKIVIETRFTLSKIVGIRIAPQVDFTDPNEPRHDITLVIDGEKVYASKQILAFHSSFFNAMFYGNFDEKNKTEVELKEIKRKEFVEMLHVIYPSYAKITAGNYEFLLKLGDRYQIKLVIDQVEKFLINSTNLTFVEKLKISDQYRLVELQDHCLDSFKTIKDITDIKDTDGYNALSALAKATLMDKIMTLK